MRRRVTTGNEQFISQSTSELKLESEEFRIGTDDLDSPDHPFTESNRVSLSAGTTFRLSTLNKLSLKRHNNNTEDWHTDVLQTARVLNEQLSHIAKMMKMVDPNALYSVVERNDSQNGSHSIDMSPELKNACSTGLNEILSKVRISCLLFCKFDVIVRCTRLPT